MLSMTAPSTSLSYGRLGDPPGIYEVATASTQMNTAGVLEEEDLHHLAEHNNILLKPKTLANDLILYCPLS
jgi:hypothetical protein